MPKAFPLEFRADMVAVARKGKASIAQVAKDFGVSESCLQRWLKLAEIEDGSRPGTNREEAAELREAKNRKVGLPVHDDHVRRVFTAAAPNLVWLTDITEHATSEGKLYLCAITCTPTGSWASRSVHG